MRQKTSIFSKKISVAAAALLGFLGALCGQEEIVGKDAPEDFSWKKPLPEEMSYRLISLDNVPRRYYVQTGDFFAPVEMRGKSLGRLYPNRQAGKIVFYDRFPIEDGSAKKGMARFVPALTADTGGSSDIIIGVYSAQGKTRAGSVDISLEKMPLGSFSVINLSPKQMGFAVAKKSFKLSFFQSSVHQFEAGKRRPIGVPFDIFSFEKGSKPVHLSNKKCTFLGGERTLALVFYAKKIKESVGSLSEDYGKKKEPGYSESVDDILFVTDKGPRT